MGLEINDIWFALNSKIYGFHMPTLEPEDLEHCVEIREQMCGEYLTYHNPFKLVELKSGRAIITVDEKSLCPDYLMCKE